MNTVFIIRGPNLEKAMNDWWVENFDRFADVLQAVKEEIPAKYDPSFRGDTRKAKAEIYPFITLEVIGRIKGHKTGRVSEKFMQISKGPIVWYDTYEDTRVYVISYDRGESMIVGVPMDDEKLGEYHEFLSQIVAASLEQAGLEVEKDTHEYV